MALMRTSLTTTRKYLTVACLLGQLFPLTGQITTLPLLNANCRMFKGHLYCFGFRQGYPKSSLKIYKLNNNLVPVDSAEINQDVPAADKCLRLYSDTLHNRLSIFIGHKDNNKVDIIRLDASLRVIGGDRQVETARVNNTQLFGSSYLYYKTFVYSVFERADSSGRQFFLNRYQLKDPVKNADYSLNWQYPFERKNVNHASIIFADDGFVLLYVTINSGIKAGQWLLKISAAGQLIKGIKLNDKNDGHFYARGLIVFDKANRSINLCGQKFSPAEWDAAQYKLNIVNASSASLYLISIDSLNETEQHYEIKLPLVPPSGGAKKPNTAFILRPLQLQKITSGEYEIVMDIYRSNGGPTSYFYSNTQKITVTSDGEKAWAAKQSLSANSEIEQFYLNSDKNNNVGKINVEQLAAFETLFYTEPVLPVKLAWKPGENAMPLWLLSRPTVQKNSISFNLLEPQNKLYKLKSLEEFPRQADPAFYDLGAGTFVISSLTEDGKLQLKLFRW